MHATCAQKHTLLEIDPNQDMKEPYFIFCKQHASTESKINPWYKYATQPLVKESTGSSIVIKLESKILDTLATNSKDPRDRIKEQVAEMASQQDIVVREMQSEKIRLEQLLIFMAKEEESNTKLSIALDIEKEELMQDQDHLSTQSEIIQQHNTTFLTNHGNLSKITFM